MLKDARTWAKHTGQICSRFTSVRLYQIFRYQQNRFRISIPLQTSMAKSEKTCCMWLTLYLDSNNLTTHGIKTLRKAYPQAFSSWTGRHDYSSICEKFYNWSNWILSYWLMIRVFLKINTGMLKNRPKLNQRHKHD